MHLFIEQNNQKQLKRIQSFVELSNILPIDSLPITYNNIVTASNFQYLKPFSTINIQRKLKAGSLSEDDKALALKRLNVQVCRKCCARLSPRAEHCRKRMCGYSIKLRLKKKLREVGKK